MQKFWGEARFGSMGKWSRELMLERVVNFAPIQSLYNFILKEKLM
jgi:hypothetical protein